ncbi:ATP-binding cassette domain-containing protein [Pseudomonas aeruginosa]|nr:ATP-binding cassette domain-containing protein [Pseudomonas aeruginosa]
MGPSGCGKTTLLRLIASQLRPSKGEVWVNGQNCHAAFARRPVRHAQAVRRAVPERGAVHRSRRLRERRVSAACAYPAAGRDDPRHRPDEASGRRPARRRGTDADELSGGMKRRVALARAIALDPQILLYDEPSWADPIAMGVLVRLIRLLNDALGITSIVVSRHDLAETASIADYIYIVGDGRVSWPCGAPDVLKETDDPRIRQFVKGIPDGPVPFHYPARDYRADLLGER